MKKGGYEAMVKLGIIIYCIKLVLRARYVGESYIEEGIKKRRILIFD